MLLSEAKEILRQNQYECFLNEDNYGYANDKYTSWGNIADCVDLLKKLLGNKISSVKDFGLVLFAGRDLLELIEDDPDMAKNIIQLLYSDKKPTEKDIVKFIPGSAKNFIKAIPVVVDYGKKEAKRFHDNANDRTIKKLFQKGLQKYIESKSESMLDKLNIDEADRFMMSLIISSIIENYHNMMHFNETGEHLNPWEMEYTNETYKKLFDNSIDIERIKDEKLSDYSLDSINKYVNKYKKFLKTYPIKDSYNYLKKLQDTEYIYRKIYINKDIPIKEQLDVNNLGLSWSYSLDAIKKYNIFDTNAPQCNEMRKNKKTTAIYLKAKMNKTDMDMIHTAFCIIAYDNVDNPFSDYSADDLKYDERTGKYGSRFCEIRLNKNNKVKLVDVLDNRGKSIGI